MKIIEPGKVGRNWTLRHRCTAWGNDENGCDALLEVEYDDLRYYPGTPVQDKETWGDRDPAVCFKCPCCGKLTDLGRNDWPAGYRNLTPWSAEWRDARPSLEHVS